jgi:hypothetical protein
MSCGSSRSMARSEGTRRRETRRTLDVSLPSLALRRFRQTLFCVSATLVHSSPCSTPWPDALHPLTIPMAVVRCPRGLFSLRSQTLSLARDGRQPLEELLCQTHAHISHSRCWVPLSRAPSNPSPPRSHRPPPPRACRVCLRGWSPRVRDSLSRRCAALLRGLLDEPAGWGEKGNDQRGRGERSGSSRCPVLECGEGGEGSRAGTEPGDETRRLELLGRDGRTTRSRGQRAARIRELTVRDSTRADLRNNPADERSRPCSPRHCSRFPLSLTSPRLASHRTSLLSTLDHNKEDNRRE